jgi:hypothetical protein
MILEEKDHINIIDNNLVVSPKASWQDWVIGKPLPTDQVQHQTINKIVGLAVFSSDALSSVA